jgi:hypothetical protein
LQLTQRKLLLLLRPLWLLLWPMPVALGWGRRREDCVLRVIRIESHQGESRKKRKHAPRTNSIHVTHLPKEPRFITQPKVLPNFLSSYTEEVKLTVAILWSPYTS